MAKRRCISVDFYDSEAFGEMPNSAKFLYTELILHSDDDGVVINPKAVLRLCNSSRKTLDLLLERNFLMLVDGLYIIRHWYVHNKVQPSRKVDSIYKETLSKLCVDEAKRYCLCDDGMSSDCRPNITEYKLKEDKISKDKSREEKENAEAPYCIDDDNVGISDPITYDGISDPCDETEEYRAFRERCREAVQRAKDLYREN